MKSSIFFTVFIVLVALGFFIFESQRFNDGKFHVVFCNVGQGDAIFIRTPKGSDILVDGGPSDNVSSCLSSYMPFWDRTIEVMLLTHPHADHLNGLLSVLQRYSVLYFGTENIKNTTAGYKALIKSVESQKVTSKLITAGDKFKIQDGVVLKFLGPTQAYLDKTSPHGIVGETGEFGSLLTEIEYGSIKLLLTGDSQAGGIEEGVGFGDVPIDIIQVPHHGSKTGLNSSVLDSLKPKLAVISVGAKNKYGHPTPEILKMLGDYDIKILRTDKNGTIEIVSDGKSYSIE